VDLRVARGQLCFVLGPNGAGKSTLIRVIGGLLELTAGEVRLLGAPPGDARTVAMVAQQNDVAFGFTVREVVAMGRAPHQDRFMRQTTKDRQAVESALATCSLTELCARPVDELSGGEQKRVHIARAFAQQAPILLLDEAAAHLDIRHESALYALVRQEVRARELACVMTTHDLDAAARHADHVVLLADGGVVAEGTVAEVMRSELLEATFGVAVEVVALPGGGRHFMARPGG
jgi:iron complex transport system ATP-binding protein